MAKTDRQNNSRQDGITIWKCQMVDKFIYLGILILYKRGSKAEIRRICELAKWATRELQKILVDDIITLNSKKQILATLIFPNILYGVESWKRKIVLQKSGIGKEYSTYFRIDPTEYTTAPTIFSHSQHKNSKIFCTYHITWQELVNIEMLIV